MITWIKKYPVTTFLVASNVVLFAAMVIATGPQTLLGPPVSVLIHWGANFGPMALTNEPWRLLSNAFVHCHLLHLLLNMYALFVVGPDLEQRIGKVQYSLLYIITALGGSLLSVEFHPVQVSAGASGAIFGLVGCYLAYIPPQFAKQGKKTLKRRIMVLFLFLAINFAFAQIVGNVDNAAHMGGLITGLLFGWVASKTTLKDRPLLAYMNSLGLLLLCLSSYLFMSAQYNNDPRLLAHREFFDGMTLLQDKKYGEALTRFDKTIEIEQRRQAESGETKDTGDLVTYYLARAEVLRNLKRYQEAFNSADQAWKLAPENLGALANKAILLHHLGRYQEEISLNQMLCEKAPDQSMTYNNLAWSQLATGSVSEALKNVNVALSKNHDNYAALDTRGVAYLLLNKPDQARKDLDEAIADDPKCGGCHFHLAALFNQQRDNRRCKSELDTALRLDYEPEQWETIVFKDVYQEYERMRH